MSKQSTGAQSRTASQPAQTRRQRRRPRGEVYRQPPRVRTRTQSAVQALDASRSGTWDAQAMAPVATDEPPVATSVAEPSDGEMSVWTNTATLAETAGPSDSHSQSRLPRRTRTLADVVQPRRDPALSGGSLSMPSLPSLPAFSAMPVTGPLSDPELPATTSAAMALAAAGVDTSPPVPAPTEAAQWEGDEPCDQLGTAVGDRQDGEARTAPLATVHASSDDRGDPSTSGSRPVASIPVPRGARVSVETRPIAAIDDASSLARSGSRVRAGDPWGTSPAALKNDDEIPSRFLRGARQGTLALAVRVAQGHAVAAMVLAIVASALVLLAHPLGLWLLALAGLAAAGGGLAHLLLWWRRSARMGMIVLVLAQMGALAWGCALVGPRAALLVLATPAVALALRAGGRWPATLASVGLVAVYATFYIAPNGRLQPVFVLPLQVLAAVDIGAVALGIGLLLAELLVAAHARERDLAAARARLYEVRLLRAQIGALRAEVEDNGRALDEALTQAVRGRSMDPVVLDGPLSLVAERVNVAAERLQTLQHDRAERLRLEGATRTLARALQRGWLGLAWVWPEASGTMLDEVIGLLRTPRPADSLIEQRENPADEMRAPSLP